MIHVSTNGVYLEACDLHRGHRRGRTSVSRKSRERSLGALHGFISDRTLLPRNLAKNTHSLLDVADALPSGEVGPP